MTAEGKTTVHPHIDARQWLTDHGDALYRFAFAVVRHHAEAEDLVQQTLLSAWQSRDRYSGNASVRTWLTAILKHRVADHFRTRRPEFATPDLSFHDEAFNASGCWNDAVSGDLSIPPGGPERGEFLATLDQCVTALPDPLRHVFCLREFAGLATGEICDILRISPTNLSSILYRARLQLRACMEKRWSGRRSGDFTK